MHRLFIAIEIPENIKKELNSICYGIPNARWVDDYHLTIRFIGEVDRHMFCSIEDGMRNIDFPSFSISLKGVGYFSTKGEPSVLWAGVHKKDELKKLRKKINTALNKIGIMPQVGKFSPHITLARLHNVATSGIEAYLDEYALFRSLEFEVEEFHLYSSVLGKSRAVHTKESSFELISRPE